MSKNQSLVAVPLKLGAYTFKPSPTGSEKLHRADVPARWIGTNAQDVVDFLAHAGGEKVRARFSLGEGEERPKRGRGRRDAEDVELVARVKKTATIGVAGEGRARIDFGFVVESEDMRAIRELGLFLIESARIEALEVVATFELIQPELPMGENDGTEAA